MAMLNPNIMALLQGSMSSSPFGVGPIAPQNPTPGFRAAPMGGMPQVPRMRPQDNTGMQNGMGMLGLAGAMQRLGQQPQQPTWPTGAPGAPVGTPGTSTFLGGSNNPDTEGTTAQLAAANGGPSLAGGMPGANGTPNSNSFIDFLTGLKTRLFS